MFLSYLRPLLASLTFSEFRRNRFDAYFNLVNSCKISGKKIPPKLIQNSILAKLKLSDLRKFSITAKIKRPNRYLV